VLGICHNTLRLDSLHCWLRKNVPKVGVLSHDQTSVSGGGEALSSAAGEGEGEGEGEGA
jgi:hypothetical protein